MDVVWLNFITIKRQGPSLLLNQICMKKVFLTVEISSNKIVSLEKTVTSNQIFEINQKLISVSLINTNFKTKFEKNLPIDIKYSTSVTPKGIFPT